MCEGVHACMCVFRKIKKCRQQYLERERKCDVNVSRFHSTPTLYTITYYDWDNFHSLISPTNES